MRAAYCKAHAVKVIGTSKLQQKKDPELQQQLSSWHCKQSNSTALRTNSKRILACTIQRLNCRYGMVMSDDAGSTLVPDCLILSYQYVTKHSENFIIHKLYSYMSLCKLEKHETDVTLRATCSVLYYVVLIDQLQNRKDRNL